MARRKKHPLLKKGSVLMNPMQQKNALKSLLIAFAITVALYFVPYAGIVTYPIRLLVTFIHEGCHALAALLTGGVVRQIAIQGDGSGVTATVGGIGVFIASAGYLGATLYGTALLALLRRGIAPKILLLTTAIIVGLLTVFFVHPFPDWFSTLWGIIIALLLGILAFTLPPQASVWAAAFVGVQCVMNAFFDLKTLLNISVYAGGTPSDAYNMQQLTWIPAPLWALLWLGLAVYLLWAVLLSPTLQASGALKNMRLAR